MMYSDSYFRMKTALRDSDQLQQDNDTFMFESQTKQQKMLLYQSLRQPILRRLNKEQLKMLKSAVEELSKNESKGKGIEELEADWKIIQNLQKEILQSFRDITKEEITTLKEEEASLKEESAAVKEDITILKEAFNLNDEKVKEEEEDVIEKANLTDTSSVRGMFSRFRMSLERLKALDRMTLDRMTMMTMKKQLTKSEEEITKDEITTLKEEAAAVKEEESTLNEEITILKEEALNDEKVKEEEAVKEEEGVKEAAAVKEEDVMEKANLTDTSSVRDIFSRIKMSLDKLEALDRMTMKKQLTKAEEEITNILPLP